MNYATYRLQGGSHGGDDRSARWDLTYTFDEAYRRYGVDKYDPASLDDLAGKIESDDQACQEFMTYYNYDGSAKKCSRGEACALSRIFPKDFGQCR